MNWTEHQENAVRVLKTRRNVLAFMVAPRTHRTRYFWLHVFQDEVANGREAVCSLGHERQDRAREAAERFDYRRWLAEARKAALRAAEWHEEKRNEDAARHRNLLGYPETGESTNADTPTP